MADSSPAVADLRAPQQQRSRASFERVQDAALALLRERGSDTFTLAEVSTRAAVSTGSIYGRVTSKDALIRLVHEREMQRVDETTRERLGSAAAAAADLRAAVPTMLSTLDALLRAEAPVLRPFMARAAHDAVVSATGRRSAELAREAFCEALLRHRDEVRRPDPVAAVHWCHTVAYSVLARHHGLSTTLEAVATEDTSRTVQDLSSTLFAYLVSTGEDDPAAASAPRRRRRR